MRHNTSIRMVVSLLGLLAMVAALPVTGHGTVPGQVNYQGYLTDIEGKPLNGAYGMVFSIYNVSTGGAELWWEDQNVSVTDGIYNVQLGAVNPLDLKFFSENAVYLEVNIFNSDTKEWETLSPRQQLTSTPYAFLAENAQMLGGKSSAAYSPAEHAHSGDDITSGTIGAAHIDAAIARDSEVTWTNLSGVPADLADGDQVGVTTETDPTITNPSVKDGVSWNELSGIPLGFADNIDDIGLTEETDPQVGGNTLNHVPKWNGNALTTGTIFDNGRVGIGTTSPIDKLSVYGGSISVDGAEGGASLRLRQNDTMMWTFLTAPWIGDNDLRIRNEGATGDVMTFDKETGNIGVGTTTPSAKLHIVSPSITGVFVASTDSTGVYSTSENSRGVYGFSVKNSGVLGDSVEYNGVYGYSHDLAGVYGTSVDGVGVHGYVSRNGGIGVYGEAPGDLGRGVYGTAQRQGVYGYAVDIFGRGVEGEASGTYGSGVQGVATGSNGRGVYGRGELYDFYAGGDGTNYGPFTGAHEVRLAPDLPADIQAGVIVSATGRVELRQNENGDSSISSTLPTVTLSSKAKDRAVIGVLVFEALLPRDHWYEAQETERFGVVNALGEGRVLVTNITGDIEAGDYITSSDIPGYGQLQDDDLVHSYTVGKAIETIDWGSVTETIEYNGVEYKIYLISVVYTSG